MDNEAPTIKILSPANNVILNMSSVLVEWSDSDANSGIDYYEIRVNSGSWVNVGTSTSYSLNMEDGNHTIYVKAVDRAGNFRIEKITIKISESSGLGGIIGDSESSNWLVPAIIGIVAAILIIGIIAGGVKKKKTSENRK